MLAYENIFVFAFVLPVYQLLFYTVQQVTFSRRQATRFYNGLLMLCMLLLLIINASLHLGGSHWLRDVMQIAFFPLLFCLFPLFYFSLYSVKEIRQSTTLVFRVMLFAPPAVFLLAGMLFSGFSNALRDASALFQGCSFASPGFHLNVRVLLYCFLLPLLLTVQAVWVFTRLRAALHSGWQQMRLDVRLMASQKPSWLYAVFASLFVFAVILSLVGLFFEMRNLAVVVGLNTLLLVAGGIPGLVCRRYRVLTLLDNAGRANATAAHTEIQIMSQEDAEPADVPDLLSKKEARALRRRLEELMKAEKPYLEPGYSLDDLCNKLEVDRRVMTWFLNHVIEKNFYSLINDYRIVEAIQYLKQNSEKYTIDAIARMVGFRSKSSFYAGFKKHTGTTPNAYLKDNSAR